MADRWIRERFENYQAKLAAQQQREEWNHKARTSYDAQFDLLKSRVGEDVKTYNELFAQHKDCIAKFVAEFQGKNTFIVECARKGKNVMVEKVGFPIIKAYWNISHGVSPERSGVLEIAADDEGAVRFKHFEEFLPDVSDASKVILDSVLCGETE